MFSLFFFLRPGFERGSLGVERGIFIESQALSLLIQSTVTHDCDEACEMWFFALDFN